MLRTVESGGEKVDGLKQDNDSTNCNSKNEAIDDRAVIERSYVSEEGNGRVNEKGFTCFAECSERKGQENATKHGMEGKQDKQRRRKTRDAKTFSGKDKKENILTHLTEAENGYKSKSDEAKRAYSRKEMEDLRFMDLGAQKKKWIEVYCGLATNVAEEYDRLLSCDHQKCSCFAFDPRQQFQNKETPHGARVEDYSQVGDDKIDNMESFNAASSLKCEQNFTVMEEECDEEDESDDDYSSIQRPAFLVTGEPNFDSGPPQDGWEYLRRVRWEAAQIPRVKVAKLENVNLNREQTVYMPQIPDIAKCPEHLLPLKQWEDTFIHDFSELRQALSHLDCSGANISAQFQFQSLIDEEEHSNRSFEDFDKLTIESETSEALNCSLPEDFSASLSHWKVDDNNVSPAFEKSHPNSVRGRCTNSATLSKILRMDSVGRLSMLRKRISLVESMSSLSKNECVWLFALCAVIDTPLDADTCAVLRSLLRKCASLRAKKSEMDDEVVMLNIIATITGKYFGQSEYQD